MDEEILDYNGQKEGWVSKMVDWQKKHISDRQMTLILAFIIGLLASVAGYFLHGIVHEIQLLLTSGFNKGTYNLLFLLFPIVGIYLTMLFIKYVVRDNISHGITRVLYAISTKNSKLKAHNCWSSVVASGITIGFGGSVGAEAPIVLTGSAIGSNLGQIFRMDKKTMILLVGCGASAAIAGIFKAPIAGLVFTLEVLMVDLSMASLLPILISCVTATCFTYILMGSKSLFDFTLTNPWALDRVPAYNYGARRPSRVRKAMMVMGAMMLGYTAIMWSIIIVFPNALIGIFSSDATLMKDAVPALKQYFAAFIFMDCQYIGQTVFKSLNKKKQAIFFSLLRKVFIVVPLTYLMPYALHMGTDGVFLAEPVSNVIGGGLCFVVMLCTVLPELKKMEQ